MYFYQSSVTSPLLDPNIFLSTLFSKSCNTCKINHGKWCVTSTNKSVLGAIFEADLTSFMIFSGVNEVATGGARRLQLNRIICEIDTFVIFPRMCGLELYKSHYCKLYYRVQFSTWMRRLLYVEPHFNKNMILAGMISKIRHVLITGRHTTWIRSGFELTPSLFSSLPLAYLFWYTIGSLYILILCVAFF
jgi:hypothetical protein